MAVLSNGDRNAVQREFMRRTVGPSSFTKAQLMQAVNAADNWMDTNMAVFTLALPLLMQSAMNAEQRALLYSLVAMRRAGILRTQEDG